MALTEERQEQSAPEKRRPAASQVLEGLGILLALGTLALGLLGTVPDHPDLEVGREVFGNIPTRSRSSSMYPSPDSSGSRSTSSPVGPRAGRSGPTTAAPGFGGNESRVSVAGF